MTNHATAYIKTLIKQIANNWAEDNIYSNPDVMAKGRDYANTLYQEQLTKIYDRSESIIQDLCIISSHKLHMFFHLGKLQEEYILAMNEDVKSVGLNSYNIHIPFLRHTKKPVVTRVGHSPRERGVYALGEFYLQGEKTLFEYLSKSSAIWNYDLDREWECPKIQSYTISAMEDAIHNLVEEKLEILYKKHDLSTQEINVYRALFDTDEHGFVLKKTAMHTLEKAIHEDTVLFKNNGVAITKQDKFDSFKKKICFDKYAKDIAFGFEGAHRLDQSSLLEKAIDDIKNIEPRYFEIITNRKTKIKELKPKEEQKKKKRNKGNIGGLMSMYCPAGKKEEQKQETINSIIRNIMFPVDTSFKESEFENSNVLKDLQKVLLQAHSCVKTNSHKTRIISDLSKIFQKFRVSNYDDIRAYTVIAANMRDNISNAQIIDLIKNGIIEKVNHKFKKLRYVEHLTQNTNIIMNSLLPKSGHNRQYFTLNPKAKNLDRRIERSINTAFKRNKDVLTDIHLLMRIDNLVIRDYRSKIGQAITDTVRQLKAAKKEYKRLIRLEEVRLKSERIEAARLEKEKIRAEKIASCDEKKPLLTKKKLKPVVKTKLKQNIDRGVRKVRDHMEFVHAYNELHKELIVKPESRLSGVKYRGYSSEANDRVLGLYRLDEPMFYDALVYGHGPPAG